MVSATPMTLLRHLAPTTSPSCFVCSRVARRAVQEDILAPINAGCLRIRWPSTVAAMPCRRFLQSRPARSESPLSWAEFTIAAPNRMFRAALGKEQPAAASNRRSLARSAWSLTTMSVTDGMPS